MWGATWAFSYNNSVTEWEGDKKEKSWASGRDETIKKIIIFLKGLDK